MSSPMIGSPRSSKRRCQYGCEAMKTGMQLMNAQPASSTCSTYHFVAISEPTGRYEITTSVCVFFRMPTMSSVEPRDFCDHLLEIFAEAVVRHAAMHFHAERRHVGELAWCCSARRKSLRRDRGRPSSTLTSKAAENSMSRGVIAAEIHVHQAGHEVVLASLRGRTRRPARATRRSCRRR